MKMMHLTSACACAFIVTLLSTHACAFQVPRAFQIRSDETSFRVIVKGVEVLAHTPTEPLVSVGNVDTTFKEMHGTWHIDEHVQKRVALPQFAITEKERSMCVRLWTLQGPEVELELVSDNFNPLAVRWVTVAPGYDRVWMRITALEDEHVYGAGEQNIRLDLRGHNYPIWTSEQGIGQNNSHLLEMRMDSSHSFHPSHFPLPTFVSSRHYYCHVSGSNYVHLDFRHSKYHEISIHGRPETIYFNIDNSFEALVRSLSYFLWRQPQLPDWVHTGAILGVEGGTKKMLEYYAAAKAAGVEVSGLWIRDWSGNIDTQFGKMVYWNWVWNEDHYPGLDKEVRRLKAEGVRVLTYVTPNLHSQGTLFEEAEQKGYLLKGKGGQTFLRDLKAFRSATVDLTNPEAFDWYKGVLTRNLIDTGFGGWMADFSEDTPIDAVFHNGVDALHMHNAFPVLWARLNREVIKEAGMLGEVMFFMRAGGTGSSKYTTMTWAGDQRAGWSLSNGLPTVIPAALSLGLSGVGLTHFGIGLPAPEAGSPGKPKAATASPTVTPSLELHLRSAELAVFTAVMRTQQEQTADYGSKRGSSNEKHPTLNWQINNSTLKRFGALTRQYRHLMAYRKAVELEQYRQGLPMQRPLFLHYQRDGEAFTSGYQYLLGRDLLVAPVLALGATSWEVFLPADVWEHLWTGQVYAGPRRVTVQAPVGEPPVFFRETSMWSDTFRGLKAIGAGSGGERPREEL